MLSCLFENKLLGETSTEFSNRIKRKYNATKVAICGKLDPMAYGLVRILLDDDTKLMEQHLDHTKKYEFLLFHGIKTSSDDILGEVIDINRTNNIIKTIDFIKNELTKRTTQHYHPFSAIRILHNGIRKSLHHWTRNNISVELPQKNTSILNINIAPLDKLSLSTYKENIFNQLNKINNSNYSTFKVQDSIDSWRNLEYNELIYYNKITIEVCSGYYIRMIPHYIYNELGICTHIMNINRIAT